MILSFQSNPFFVKKKKINNLRAFASSSDHYYHWALKNPAQSMVPCICKEIIGR
jgi:hypothetical protein